MTLPRPLRWILKGCATLLILGVVAIVVIYALLRLEHRREVTLPTPSGPFAVGRTIQDWVDRAALDTLAPLGTQRELLAWIWYPSADSAAPVDDYLPANLRLKPEDRPSSNIWTLLTADAANVRGHSARNPGVSTKASSYPVVILRAGASAGVLGYSVLAEDLASHGYIVVGFDAPWRTGLVVFPDGRTFGRSDRNNPELCVGKADQERCADRLLAGWTSDMAFALDWLARLNASDSSGRFTGRLDMARVGVFGHSFGGAAAAQFCHDDARCKAGIDIDGAPHGTVIGSGLHQPFMFLLSDHGLETDSISRGIRADIRSVYDRLPADGRLLATIRGSFHFMFSDDGALFKSALVRGLLRVSGRLRIDARRQLAVTSYCVQAFFDAYLKGLSPRPAIPSPLYPEVQVE